jgi:4'-phosphopantetheinyl transferase
MISPQHQIVVPESPGPQQIHLWLLDLERHRSQSFSAGALLLDDEEQRRADRFRRERDRQQYRLTRTTVRNVLSSYCRDIEPARWRFSKNLHGKPAIASPQPNKPICFNISHSGRWLAIAVSASEGAGVDVEMISDARSMLAIAGRYFCPSEYSSLCDLTPAESALRFYELWTLKEAYSKALGNALVPTLGQLEISFPDEVSIAARLRAEAAEGCSLSGWSFCLFAMANYRLALAMRNEAGTGGIAPSVWEIDNPLMPGAARAVELSPIRCSSQLTLS